MTPELDKLGGIVVTRLLVDNVFGFIVPFLLDEIGGFLVLSCLFKGLPSLGGAADPPFFF